MLDFMNVLIGYLAHDFKTQNFLIYKWILDPLVTWPTLYLYIVSRFEYYQHVNMVVHIGTLYYSVSRSGL